MIGGDEGFVPSDWDRLAERQEDPTAEGRFETPHGPAPPPSTLSVVASGWGDALALMAVCTAEIAAVHALGLGYSRGTVLWAAAASMAWWILASAVLLAIRQGTVGMLMAGVATAGPVPPSRLPLVLVAAATAALLLGLPGVLGARRHPVSIAARRPLTPSGLSNPVAASGTTPPMPMLLPTISRLVA